VVKHAGLCPRDNASGAFAGRTTISGRGRPLLRLAAWRAVWGALPHNPVFAARHAHLTSRQHNRLSDGQARSAVAAALLRQLWVVWVNRIPWELAVASGTAGKEVTDPAAEHDLDAAGRARPGLGNNPLISLGRPAHLLQARMRAVGTNPIEARWSRR
jgi:Transposase IS116/IS110/IS902 family